MQSRGENSRSQLASFPLYHPLKGILGLVTLNDDTADWLHEQHSASDKIGPDALV